MQGSRTHLRDDQASAVGGEVAPGQQHALELDVSAPDRGGASEPDRAGRSGHHAALGQPEKCVDQVVPDEPRADRQDGPYARPASSHQSVVKCDQVHARG